MTVRGVAYLGADGMPGQVFRDPLLSSASLKFRAQASIRLDRAADRQPKRSVQRLELRFCLASYREATRGLAIEFIQLRLGLFAFRKFPEPDAATCFWLVRTGPSALQTRQRQQRIFIVLYAGSLFGHAARFAPGLGLLGRLLQSDRSVASSGLSLPRRRSVRNARLAWPCSSQLVARSSSNSSAHSKPHRLAGGSLLVASASLDPGVCSFASWAVRHCALKSARPRPFEHSSLGGRLSDAKRVSEY